MGRCLFRFLRILILTSVAHAAPDSAPTIRNSQIGFSHQFINKHWQTVAVELHNPGPATDLTLVLEPASRADGQNLIVTRPVHLPAQSRRTVWFPGRPETPEPPADRNANSKINIVKVSDVKLTDGGLKIFDRLDMLGRYWPDNAAVVLVADARMTTYRAPTDLPGPLQRRPIARVTSSHDLLPETIAGFDPAHLLILGDPGPTRLRPLQRETIRAWIRAGGTALFSPNAGSDALEWHEWADILPATIGPLDRLATESLLTRWGDSPTFSNGIAYARLTPHSDATILVGDRNNPFLVTRRVGRGQVAVVALDTGDQEFQRWSGATNFTAELLALATQPVTPAPDQILERSPATDAIVSSLAGIKVLGRGLLLSYLIVVLVGLLAMIGTFRFTRTPERGWYVGAGIAVVTGIVAILGADLWKRQPQPFLNELNIIAVAPDGRHATTHTALGLFAPRAGNFTLTADSSAVAIRPKPTARGSATDPFAIEWDAVPRIPALSVRANDIRPLYGTAPLPATNWPVAAAELDATGLQLTIQNKSRQPLTDAFFKFNRLVVPLGDIPAGATRSFPRLTGTDTFTSRVVQSSADELRQRLRRVFFPDPAYTFTKFATRSGWMEGIPAVYAWTDNPTFPIQVAERNVARRAVNLITIPATLTTAGPKLTLPAGTLTLRLRGKEARLIERGEGKFSGTRSAQVVADFSLPAGVPDLAIESARVTLTIRSDAFRTRTELIAPDGKRKFTLPADGVIPNPGQWYNPTHRSFTVAVDIEALTSEAVAVNYWQIRELDLELGGSIP